DARSHPGYFIRPDIGAGKRIAAGLELEETAVVVDCCGGVRRLSCRHLFVATRARAASRAHRATADLDLLGIPPVSDVLAGRQHDRVRQYREWRTPGLDQEPGAGRTCSDYERRCAGRP